MAKKQARSAELDSNSVNGRSLEDAALGFAEDLGQLLGTAEKKANDWLQQRSDVTKQLTELRDKATQLLERLGGEATAGIKRSRKAGTGRGPGRPPGSTNQAATGGRKRSQMSAAARKAVGERMRKYWAARRKAEGK